MIIKYRVATLGGLLSLTIQVLHKTFDSDLSRAFE